MKAASPPKTGNSKLPVRPRSNPEHTAPEYVDTSVLRAEPYQYARSRSILVRIEQPEFTSLCPMTGQPDFGTVTIEYVPGDRIVELKSLKLYLLAYRQVGIFYEHVVNRILDDLVRLLDPIEMTVEIRFTPRGGISTAVAARHPQDSR